MNIFYLDTDPLKAAQAHYDIHVRKMIVESAQMLSTAHRVLDGHCEIKLNKINRNMKVWVLDNESNEILYKSTHVNHPCNIWIRESKDNYNYLLELFKGLLNEYTFRWGKIHATTKLLEYLSVLPKNIPYISSTPFRLTTNVKINAKYKDRPVDAYREYYSVDKSKFNKYTKRSSPSWLK